MIRIGNQTSFAAVYPSAPFAYALAQGFQAFEWFPDKHGDAGWVENDLSTSLRAEIRDAARAADMSLSVHARWDANPLQAASYPVLWQDLELAQDLGAELLNIHLYEEAGVAAFIEAILPLARRAAEVGLRLAVENAPVHAPEDFNALFAALRQFQLGGQVGMCLDLGHANLSAATHNRYLEFVDRLDSRVPIIHAHLHENWGDADTHLPLFTGPAGQDDSGIRGLLERLRDRGFSGSMILEQWPEPPSLLNRARDRLLALLGEDPSARRLDGDEVQASLRHAAPASARPQAGELQTTGTAVNPTSHPSAESPGPEPRGGVAGLVNDLAEVNRKSASWREKLDGVRDTLARRGSSLTEVELVDAAVYLRFLGTGALPCAEDGRHFRPSHHARIASQIRGQLARFKSPPEVLVAREIYPWLPSTGPAFRRAEPLTRIRDLAHRNDIPPDLKRELKVTLQNKLHRCAGPEDLATSRALLQRFTDPRASYPPEFVDQFRIFHGELEEFFNARSLDRQLEALLPEADGRMAGLIRTFLEQRGATDLRAQLTTLQLLVELRELCLQAGAGHREIEGFLLADIGLEDFAFVLLSGIINSLDLESAPVVKDQTRGSRQRFETVGGTGENGIALLLEAMRLTLKNLRLSYVEPEECKAIESEVGAWSRHLELSDPDEWLRLKATAERSRRVAETHSQQLLLLFARRAETLGRALGVAEPAIEAYGEAAIRRHLVFQLSKLASGLLRHARNRLGLRPWDVVVGGRAVGRLEAASSLGLLETGGTEPIIVLLERAEGDEEIPGRVAGVFLAHDLPHLSHLAVRARQAGVVLVADQEGEGVEKLAALAGRVILLDADVDRVEWGETAGPASVRSHRAAAVIPDVRLVSERSWIGLDELGSGLAGAKAEGSRKLAVVARRKGVGYKAPGGLVAPFGVMEAALRAVPALEQEYQGLRLAIEPMAGVEFGAATKRLRELLRSLKAPAEIAEAARKAFGSERRFMVRSSANCEDLGGLAGAGLYESIANVGLPDLGAAICRVWSSLWTQRAALSRKQWGIPHARAQMAVLIQPMVPAELCFILHTTHPLRPRPGEAYVEVAAGLGEILASGARRGSPFRFACDKNSGRTETLAFASFSQALRSSADGSLAWQTVDYSRMPLSCEREVRQRLGRRLAVLARLIEELWECPQDVEGAILADEIYLVQARPQSGTPGA